MMDAPANRSKILPKPLPKTIPARLAGLLAGITFLAVTAGLCKNWLSLASTATTIILELSAGLAIFASAAGYGQLLVGTLTKSAQPALRFLTALGVGLYALGTMVLLAGVVSSPNIPLLQGGFCWPIVGTGIAIGLWQIQPAWRKWKHRTPSSVGIWPVLAWMVLAAVLAGWLCGASLPPGIMGQASGDVYDVLEYHLQVPREFYNAQHIGALTHNCYSFYPLGLEMLYLLGMALRGGPFDGMFLPAFMHGLFGVAAVTAIYLCLTKHANPKHAEASGNRQAIFSALLLASVPGLIYLSYLAKTELAQVFYLTLALLWLKHWLARPTWQVAICVGLLIGAACATKYLAIAFVAVPVLATMLVFSLRQGRLMKHVAIAGLLCLAMLSPWLIRNIVHTGNPVFPLATQSIGRGYWSIEQEHRWLSAHGRQNQPPVPQPASWQPTESASWGTLFVENLLCRPSMSPPTVILAALAMVVLIASRNSDRWLWALLIVVVIQFAFWPFSHQMPWRFVCPVAGPLALLAGGLLESLWLSRLRLSFAGPVIAGVILTATVGFNLVSAWGTFQRESAGNYMMAWSGEQLAGKSWPWSLTANLPPGSKVLLVGNAMAFYFPPNSIYATTFDTQLLDQFIQEGLAAEEILSRLKDMGITHIYVDWSETFRLASTYGFPASLSEELFTRRACGLQPGLRILDQLQCLGMRELPAGCDVPEHRFVPSASWDKLSQPGRPMQVSWPKASIFALP
jgi:hypothetical protein